MHQDIDYEALGVPVIRPGRRTRLGWLDVCLLVPVFTVTAAVGGRDLLLRRRYEVSDDSDIQIRLRFLQKVIVEERDEQLLAELARIHDERHDERIRVAVVYGAAHMPAVIQTLYAWYGYRPRAADPRRGAPRRAAARRPPPDR